MQPAQSNRLCRLLLRKHLNIPSTPMNYQHYHLHLFQAICYSITLNNQNLFFWPSITKECGVIKQSD